MNLPSLDAYDMAGASAGDMAAYSDDERDAWEAWQDADDYGHATALTH
ncbi:hypothetical protein [Kitasatospora fiedleri]|nr:hypothetical protein [Kitasatospora fiedleri]